MRVNQSKKEHLKEEKRVTEWYRGNDRKTANMVYKLFGCKNETRIRIVFIIQNSDPTPRAFAGTPQPTWQKAEMNVSNASLTLDVEVKITATTTRARRAAERAPATNPATFPQQVAPLSNPRVLESRRKRTHSTTKKQKQHLQKIKPAPQPGNRRETQVELLEICAIVEKRLPSTRIDNFPNQLRERITRKRKGTIQGKRTWHIIESRWEKKTKRKEARWLAIHGAKLISVSCCERESFKCIINAVSLSLSIVIDQINQGVRMSKDKRNEKIGACSLNSVNRVLVLCLCVVCVCVITYSFFYPMNSKTYIELSSIRLPTTQ